MTGRPHALACELERDRWFTRSLFTQREFARDNHEDEPEHERRMMTTGQWYARNFEHDAVNKLRFAAYREKKFFHFLKESPWS